MDLQSLSVPVPVILSPSASPSSSPSTTRKTVTIRDLGSEIQTPSTHSASASLRKPMSAKRNVVPRSQAESSGSSVPVLTNRGSINEGTANTSSRIIEQCLQWVTIERDKKAARRDRRKNRRMGQTNADDDASSGDEALNVLDSLLQQLPVLDPPLRVPMKRRRTLQKRRSLVAMASDSEYGSDGEVVVPECEEWLKMPEEIGWNEFKLEVLKLTHTLRCKGWRRVELERYKDIDIEKISGALTNAVYMLSPPEHVPPPQIPATTDPSVLQESTNGKIHGNSNYVTPPRHPAKLLLRIYGPQAAHLIDRDTELYILRRLARQKIGPRLLGTFENGRFEEFLSARTLTKADVRVPDTSRHIAKRLKELHEGIDLEPQERQQGPIAWKNWEKWIPRCRQVMATIDTRSNISATSLICGARWEIFEAAVERYRQWLLVTKYSNNASLLSSSLVFAHNDTQYGNILRLQIPTPTPDMTTPAQKPSPLLQPSPLLHLSNQHRQLVVIDFEYASANTPGFEFANHFCEWMADYHDASRPHFMNTAHFPSKGEMYNFLAAYVGHSLKKHLSGGPGAFSLDSRAQPPADEVQHLLDETVAWMPASSVMWCAWGIVQAKEDVKEGEFDYLLYAQQRALMFWGDCLFLGVFTEGELEEWQPGLVEKCKSGIGEWRK